MAVASRTNVSKRHEARHGHLIQPSLCGRTVRTVGRVNRRCGLVYSLAAGGEEPDAPFRSSRDILEEHLTRHDIDREEYVDRRKALDHISAIV